MTKTHPLPAGTRVHHRGGVYCRGWLTEPRPEHGPSSYIGTVLSVHSGPYPDGSYEYDVERERSLFEGGSVITQWASYHIDEHVLPPVADVVLEHEDGSRTLVDFKTDADR